MIGPQVRAAVVSMPHYSTDDLEDIGVRLRFHRNESALPPPEHVVAALHTMDPDDMRYYPAMLLHRFNEELAERIQTDVSRLVVGSGADEVLGALVRAFLDPGDNVITARPTFGMYAHLAVSTGACVRAIPYNVRWALDPAALISAADDRTKLLILGHPNNPTGDTLPAQTLIQVLSALPNVMIVVDEIYLSLSEDSYAPIVSKFDNVAVVGSLSKIAALAGMRVGFAVAPTAVAANLRKLISPFPLSSASLRAASAYIGGGSESLAFDRALAMQNARSLNTIIQRIGPLAHACWASGANFVLMDFGTIANAKAIAASLREAGIAVRAFTDPMIASCLRFCAADDTTTEQLVTAARSTPSHRGVNGDKSAH